MKKLLLTTALAAILTTPAFANSDADMSKKAEMWFNKIDANSDGFITREEHNSFGDKMFNDADANKDGKISKDEMLAEKKKEHDEWKASK